MRIVVSSLTYPLPNGVTSSINESVNGLVAAGHEVIIIAPDYNTGRVRPEHRIVSSSRFGRVWLRFFGKKERMFSLTAQLEIQDLLKEFRPDVCWLHTVSWAPNAFERQMVGRKVLTYHTMLDVYGRLYAGPIGEQAMIVRSREVANAMDEVITPSNYMAEKLRSWGVTTPLTVVPTGITAPKKRYSHQDMCKKFSLAPDAKILLYVGRVVKEKNIGTLLRCLARVVEHEPRAVLLLIGPGDIKETKEEAATLGVSRHLVCPGQLPLEEAKACYAGSDIFLFASQSETQGLVIGEAMISRLPVVAMRSPIQPEVYPESIARVADTVPALSKATLELLNDVDQRRLLVEAAYEFTLQNFSRQTMLQKQLLVLGVATKAPIRSGQ